MILSLVQEFTLIAGVIVLVSRRSSRDWIKTCFSCHVISKKLIILPRKLNSPKGFPMNSFMVIFQASFVVRFLRALSTKDFSPLMGSLIIIATSPSEACPKSSKSMISNIFQAFPGIVKILGEGEMLNVMNIFINNRPD